MREAAFVRENIDKWKKIDEQNKSKGVSADELADNFVEIADDLSYARTFYPYSQTVKYLNQLAGRYFIQIAQYKKKEKGRFVAFWKTELPTILYKRRKYLLYSFLFFAISVIIGVFSQRQDPEFAHVILGESYVNQTLQNIASGDPMAIYKSSDEAPMFIGIATNNIRVAFYAFIAGIFLSIGTVYILVSNGIMMGVFQYFFYEQGLLGTSMLSIWLHGTLEIAAIIIAGGAGLILGNSILFPGSYKRSVSLQRAVRDALKIIIGLIPIFVVAAFIESYLTRLTEMPVVLNLVIILLSAVFIFWYFILYPHKLNKRLKNGNRTETEIVTTT